MHIAMQGGIFSIITEVAQFIVDNIVGPIMEVIGGLLDFIPKFMYLMYASLVCLMDVLQLFFRKIAGLDIVYIKDPVSGKIVNTTGDLVTQFITGILGINEYDLQYSILSTVFWSFVIFGVIILFAATLVAIIKGHYNYDEKAAKGPMQYVYTAGRALVGMAIVPITIVLGLYLSQALLTALDKFTSTSDTAIISMYGSNNVSKYLYSTYTSRNFDDNPNSTTKGEKSYVFYDIFGVGSGVLYGELEQDVFDDYYTVYGVNLASVAATNATFSGTLFKAAAYNANRARLNNWYGRRSYTGGPDDEDFQLFKDAEGNEELAEMIDLAFACNLHAAQGCRIAPMYTAEDWKHLISLDIVSGLSNFTSYLTIAFSKFNVGLVWYFYDLWQFNFVVGFGAVIVCFTIFLNIILGLMARFFMCIVLFLIAPPLYGLMPLDNGQAAKNWRENFLKQVLMTYGAVVGMNLVMLILPYINQIKFFNIGIADALASTLFIIVGLITTKAVISTLSTIIGAADAQKTGEEMSKDVSSAVGGALKMTAGAAKFATKVSRYNPLERLAEKGIGAATMGWYDKNGNAHGGILRKKGADGSLVDRNGFKAMGNFFTGKTKWQQKAGDYLYGPGTMRDKQRLKQTEGQINAVEGQLGEVAEQETIDNLIESVKGQKGNRFDRDAFEVQARHAGLDDARAAALADVMDYRGHHGMGDRGWSKTDFDVVRKEFEKKDTRYKDLREKNGRTAVAFDTTKRGLEATKKGYEETIKSIEATIEAKNQRQKNNVVENLTGKWKDANPFKWINDNVVSAHPAAAGIRDAIKKPVDQQRRAADYAEQNLKLTEKMSAGTELAEENLKLTKKMLDKLDEISKKK